MRMISIVLYIRLILKNPQLNTHLALYLIVINLFEFCPILKCFKMHIDITELHVSPPS